MFLERQPTSARIYTFHVFIPPVSTYYSTFEECKYFNAGVNVSVLSALDFPVIVTTSDSYLSRSNPVVAMTISSPTCQFTLSIKVKEVSPGLIVVASSVQVGVFLIP